MLCFFVILRIQNLPRERKRAGGGNTKQEIRARTNERGRRKGEKASLQRARAEKTSSESATFCQFLILYTEWQKSLHIIKGCCIPSFLFPLPGPPEVPSDFVGRYVAHDGDTVRIHCPITGSPRPMIEWYQDERLIQHHSEWERFRVSRKSLKIKGARREDSGVFVCKGVNGFGSQAVAINLVVKGKSSYVGNTHGQRKSNFVSLARLVPPTIRGWI